MSIATMRAATILLFGFLVTAVAATSSGRFSNGNSSVLCIERERQALLKFKEGLVDESNRLSSWVEAEDCCEWDGVHCDYLTGHVKMLHLGGPTPPNYYTASDDEYEAYSRSTLGGRINPSLLELKHLSSLNLSSNNFSGLPIPEFIGSLENLTYLNLSRSRFMGEIPQRIGNLSKLQYLDLGHNIAVVGHYFVPLVIGKLLSKNLHWVSSLSSLKYLDLSNVDLAKATDWLQVTGTLPYLAELHLPNCSLTASKISANFTSLIVLDLSQNYLSSFPVAFQNSSSLKVLDLSGNYINNSLEYGNSLSTLNKLQFLSLSSNNMEGKILGNFGNLSSVFHLDLSHNHIQRIAPSFLENLCDLRVIDFSWNNIDQEVSEILHGLSTCSLDKLESVDISCNQISGSLTGQIGRFKNLAHLFAGLNSISGPIPSSIGDLSFLKSLFVSYNKLNGTLPQSIGKLSSLESLDVDNNRLNGTLPQSIGKLSSLKFLDVSSNQFNGTLPQSIGQLVSLESLDFSDNLFQGIISEMSFSNLKKLRMLEGSENTLTFNPSPNWIPPFDCEIIGLISWHLGPQIPPWLQFQHNLSTLYLSHTGISVIPNWFWNFSAKLGHIDLSNNHLTGEISYLFKGRIIDLSSNQLTGPLPRVSSDTESLFLSNNSFSGSLFHFLCNTTKENLILLHIEKNLLSKEIPNCWRNIPHLEVLNLGNNNLRGKIPKTLGSLNSLLALNLRNNNLFGEIPSTLQNCTSLIILDLGENELSGSIPDWFGSKLSWLTVLGLRSNKFHGRIPNVICALPSLQTLDLAHNYISGEIPKCFNNLRAIPTKGELLRPMVGVFFSGKDFTEGVLLVNKGREDEYSWILGLVTNVDLSNNFLTGYIPKELGSLKKLQSLNLSRNILRGRIPMSIGNMTSLESLDFSMNKLHGEIPPSFANLNFLNHLNLSYNNLTGQIPLSTQLQSFDKFSYIGNHLCGLPISKNCSTKVAIYRSSEGHTGPKVNGLYVSIVLGFVMGFWGVMAPLIFIGSWRIAYYRKLEHMSDKVYVFWRFRFVNFIGSMVRC